jgi:hypothetical protein
VSIRARSSCIQHSSAVALGSSSQRSGFSSGASQRHSARKGVGLVAFAVAAISVGTVTSSAGASTRHTPTAPTSHRGDSGQTGGPRRGDVLQTIFSGVTVGATQPDDLTVFDGLLFVAFQNGVGPSGAPSSTGATNSTVVEMSQSGVFVKSWSVPGHIDGLTADQGLGQVLVTNNEDGNTSFFTIDPASSTLTTYTYSPNNPLPHNGGTDAISVVNGQIIISASAPGAIPNTPPAPQPTYPAAYVVTLNPGTDIASLAPLFYDEDRATVVNSGPSAGNTEKLMLTDPDSSEVVPWTSPRFAGDFALDSQGDQQLVFVKNPGRPNQGLSVLNLSVSIDDSAWITSPLGTVYFTDGSDNLVEAYRGWFTPGTVYVAATPCDSNNAPATCPGPGFPPNYLGTLDLNSGDVAPVDLGGLIAHPKGLIYVGAGLGGHVGRGEG